ncbi:MAG: transketolase C-terminal domain-containing protein [Polyangiales bacterium]
MRSLSYSQALLEATDQAMARDPSVIVLGMGVDDFRGIYGTTKGLAEKYGPERCFDTPLAEDGMTGVAIGAAMAGLRPIHVHIRMDFVLLALNQIINIAAKARYMWGNTITTPLVVRAIIGRSWGQGAQHSQGLHALFMHVPGLKVVAPTTPYDAKGCLTRALRQPDPVIMIEHRLVHALTGEVPETPYELPFGRARVLRPGRDVTIVAISHMVVETLRAARHLAALGVDAEVIDPVSLAPLDLATITESVRKTGRLLVADSAWTTCGASAEITCAVVEQLQGERELRVARLGFAPVPCPTTRVLEDAFYPTPNDVAAAAYKLARGDLQNFTPSDDASSEVVEFKGPF